jgi:hypothetical protein
MQASLIESVSVGVFLQKNSTANSTKNISIKITYGSEYEGL